MLVASPQDDSGVAKCENSRGAHHGATSRRERPWRAASLSAWMRLPSAVRASLAAAEEPDFVALSISETRAEPMTAASARPPRTETWPGSEMPKPTARGDRLARHPSHR